MTKPGIRVELSTRPHVVRRLRQRGPASVFAAPPLWILL